MDNGDSHMMVEWARHAWVRRAAITTYVLLLLGLTGAYIGISRLQVQTSVYLKGQETFTTRFSNPIRGVALHAPTGRQRTHAMVELTVVPREPADDVPSSPDTADGQPSMEAQRRALEAAVDQDRVTAAWTLRPDPNSGLIEAECDLPADASSGAYWLYLQVNSPSMERFTARRAIEIVDTEGDDTDAVPERTFRLDQKRRDEAKDGTVRRQTGPIAVDLLPPDGVVARGLRSDVVVRTYRKATGAPVSARIDFTDITASAGEAAGRPPDYEPVETNAVGVATVDVDPVGDQRWELDITPLDGNPAREKPTTTATNDKEASLKDVSSATIELITVPSQTALQLETHVIYAGEDASASRRRLIGRTASLFRTGRMFGDLYLGKRWTTATSSPIEDYVATLKWEVPPVGQTTLFRTQAHRDLYVAASAWDASYVAALPDRRTETLAAAIRRVYQRLADDELAASEYAGKFNSYVLEHLETWSAKESADALERRQLETLLAIGLRALPRHFQPAEPLFNTQRGDREALESWIAEAQSDLLWLTGLALLIALLGLGAVVTHEIRKRRRHADDMRAVDVELDDVTAAGSDASKDDDSLDAPEVTLPSTGSPWLEVLLTAVILGTFVLFAVGLLLVLTYM